jgi:hypothetical protein
VLAVRLAACCERPIPKMLWIEHIRTNRDILREADARHYQPPWAWRIVVHDLSPFDPNASFKGLGRSTDRVCPHKCAYVLGTDLNRSESSRPLACPLLSLPPPLANVAIAASRVAALRSSGCPKARVHPMDSRLARRRSFMMRGRPLRSVHRIQGLIAQCSQLIECVCFLSSATA